MVGITRSKVILYNLCWKISVSLPRLQFVINKIVLGNRHSLYTRMKAAQLRYADIVVMKVWTFKSDHWQAHIPSTAATLDGRVDDANVEEYRFSLASAGGSFRCDDGPLQETLPMKQHRKLLG